MTSFLLLLIISLLLSTAHPQNDDASAMHALKKSIKNPPKGWNDDSNPCKWTGVQCQDDRVTRIQIGNLGLVGQIPEQLNSLENLQVLELMQNSLTGPLPTLKALNSLTKLYIHHNGFTSLPDDFFTGMSALENVDVGYNPFAKWTIGDNLRDAMSLVSFSAVNASIVGGIPGFLGSEAFPSLTAVELSFNRLEGGLPGGFSGSRIERLWLNGNGLNGSVSVIGDMKMLGEVWLHGNKFTGALPEFNDWGASGRLNFSFRDNHFTGVVPVSLMNLPGLHIVNLSNNGFQGAMPKFADSVEVDISGSNNFCLDEPGRACDPRVDVLLSIVKDMGYPLKLANSWSGNDPCGNGWVGIVCVGGNVTVINFKGMGFSGTISRDYGKLTSLHRIILANNALNGTIPDEISRLPSLTELDVSNNRLYGKVPDFGGRNVTVHTSGNPDIGKAEPPGVPGSVRSEGGEKSKTAVIVGGVVGGIFSIGLILGLIFWFKRSKKYNPRRQDPTSIVVHPQHPGDHDFFKISVAAAPSAGGGSDNQSKFSSGPDGDIHLVEAGNLVISIQVLRNVTNNFSNDNILGRGGFGTVYKGQLPDGTKIAVKRMESGILTDKGSNEFTSEIAVLTKVRHRHLVSLLGYCLDGNERLLVYEYMPQGTLSRHLFDWKEEGLMPLEWNRRLGIALDVARGVEYLHGLAHQSFIHRDLKPSNILLGDDMRAKVADFGLVRLAPEGKFSVETRLAGTFGYLAPEYAATGRVTTKVDVFSFGVILMELITGRKALDETQPEDSLHLVTWFRRMHTNKDTFWKAIDQEIKLDEETHASLSTVADLAGHCTVRESYQRPDMSHAVNVLSSLVEKWKPGELESEETTGINLNMSLSQVINKWKESDDDSNFCDFPFLPSKDSTQDSIPIQPLGFAAPLKSEDAR